MGGYDLQPIYSVYYSWAGRGRKPALTKAIPHEAEWQGKHNWGLVVESELVHYDFGVIRMDRLERYCTGNWIDEERAGACEFRYRYAFVPGSLYSDEKRGKLILDSFRPQELTAQLARAGWKQSDQNSLWSDKELTRIFENHLDLAALYQPLVELHEVRSSDCPGFSKALAKLDKIVLDATPDRVKPIDSEFPIHGQQTEIRLTTATSDGGKVVVEGAKLLFGLLDPVWKAVEECSPPSYKKERAN